MTIAAYQGHKKIVELLIANGADVNTKNNNGDNSLIIAAYQGHKEIVKQLTANGADVNTKNNNGDTPFVLAAYQGHTETADILRKHGGRTSEALKALMPRLVQHGRFAFSFDAKVCPVYEAHDSFPLLYWAVLTTYTGTGSSVSRFDEERDHDPPAMVLPCEGRISDPPANTVARRVKNCKLNRNECVGRYWQ